MKFIVALEDPEKKKKKTRKYDNHGSGNHGLTEAPSSVKCIVALEDRRLVGKKHENTRTTLADIVV